MKNKRLYTALVACVWFVMTSINALHAQSSSKLYKATIFTMRHSFTHGVEGPAVGKNGIVYACNFNHEGTIGQVTPSGKVSLFIELPDGSIGNGIRFDSQGNMLIADYKKHNILKVNMSTHKISVFAHDQKWYEPNDLAVDSKGHIYISDPNYKTHKGRIWRIDSNGNIVLLDRFTMGIANGIEVSPDEKTLYVGSGRKVWAYDLSPEGKVSNKRLLIKFDHFGTDGIRSDAKGNLYIARIGKGVVAKVSPQGKVLRNIKLKGKAPTNVAFGGPDGRTVYVTMMDQGNLESFRVAVPGQAWVMQHNRQ
jgi:sugar lactone lactonase YvrE